MRPVTERRDFRAQRFPGLRAIVIPAVTTLPFQRLDVRRMEIEQALQMGDDFVDRAFGAGRILRGFSYNYAIFSASPANITLAAITLS